MQKRVFFLLGFGPGFDPGVYNELEPKQILHGGKKGLDRAVVCRTHNLLIGKFVTVHCTNIAQVGIQLSESDNPL